MPWAELPTTAALPAGLTGEGHCQQLQANNAPFSPRLSSSSEAESSRTCVPKGICVIAQAVQCFSMLPSRLFLRKVQKPLHIQTMTPAPFGGVGDRLCPTSAAFTLISLLLQVTWLVFGEKTAGEESRCWKLC